LETKTFAELGLSPKVQAAIDAAGYTTPTPIQAAAIPIAVTGRDVLGIAQTGTGKTASFVLPMITRLETGRARARMPRSLILAPTRELAAQVAQSFEKYGINHKLDLALLIGGVSMDDQVKKLDRGVDVLIATPGRLLDHFQRGRLMLMGVEILVIDEADRMLDMGFIPDIEKICRLLPPRRQTLFFSATMPPEITRLVSQFLKDPSRIEVAPPATAAKTITQQFLYCPNGEDWAKRETLRELIRSQTVKNAIIFCNRKVEVAILHRSLVKHGFSAGALHGDMDQNSRTETLDKFRSGELMLLAASDVAARGLDIPDVSHIFNFDLPWQPDDYVHRIGRTGRAGKEGVSLSLVTPDELKSLKDIEKMLGEPVVWIGEPPSEQDYADSGKKRRRGGRGHRAVADAHRLRRPEATRAGMVSNALRRGPSAKRHDPRARTPGPTTRRRGPSAKSRADRSPGRMRATRAMGLRRPRNRGPSARGSSRDPSARESSSSSRPRALSQHARRGDASASRSPDRRVSRTTFRPSCATPSSGRLRSRASSRLAVARSLSYSAHLKRRAAARPQSCAAERDRADRSGATAPPPCARRRARSA
jgi:superfamily II DNA/RNA helicase